MHRVLAWPRAIGFSHVLTGGSRRLCSPYQDKESMHGRSPARSQRRVWKTCLRPLLPLLARKRRIMVLMPFHRLGQRCPEASGRASVPGSC